MQNRNDVVVESLISTKRGSTHSLSNDGSSQCVGNDDICEQENTNSNTEEDIIGVQVEPLVEMNATAAALAKVNLSFCGSGFLGVYHLGVAACLAKHGTRLLANVDNFAGASAGSLVAAVLVLNRERIMDGKAFCLNLARDLRKRPLGALTPGYNILIPLENFINSLLPMNAHTMASGKLHISLTNAISGKNEIISEYQTREELLKCLIASSYIPIYTGTKPPKIRGQRYMDGGITNNMPILPTGRTVCISPFCGRQDISPKDKTGLGWYSRLGKQDYQVNRRNVVRVLHAFFPPKVTLLEEYYEKGYRDAELFLRKEQLYSEPETVVSRVTTV